LRSLEDVLPYDIEVDDGDADDIIHRVVVDEPDVEELDDHCLERELDEIMLEDEASPPTVNVIAPSVV
jgi:hypothetical protein